MNKNIKLDLLLRRIYSMHAITRFMFSILAYTCVQWLSSILSRTLFQCYRAGKQYIRNCHSDCYVRQHQPFIVPKLRLTSTTLYHISDTAKKYAGTICTPISLGKAA